MDKLQILIREVDDWSELYINGDLLFDGSSDEFSNEVVIAIAQFLDERGDLDVEVRETSFVTEAQKEPDEEYNAPLASITDENYWNDWETAEVIFPEEVTSEE